MTDEKLSTEPWIVYDQATNVAYGCFVDADSASDYANLINPEDGDGQCIVLQLTAP